MERKNAKEVYLKTDTFVHNPSPAASRTWYSKNRPAANLVHHYLSKISGIAVVLVEGDRSWLLGDSTSAERCHVYVNNQDVYRMIIQGGTIGAAEAFMAGFWTTDNLTRLIRVLLKNRHILDGIQTGFSLPKKLSLKFFHWLRRDSIAGSKQNIATHYDLGNEFFKTFLDPTLCYSAGIFKTTDDSMEQASLNKMDALCQKLDLRPEDNLIEIGTGWGALAIHAARHYGCTVTTTTISKEQYAYTQSKIEQLGLADRITLLKQDYRLLKGKYNKLVSVEMIEAVGLEHLPLFFRKCSDLLTEDGRMILQSITIADQFYDRAANSVDFIQRYIFPGGALPSVSIMTNVAAQHTDLRCIALEDITDDYALTLAHWRTAFLQHRDEITSQGFDETFLRMWEYYLSYCEGGFLERATGCVHIRFSKPGYRSENSK